LLFWQDGTGRYDLFAQTITPDGLPRGAPVNLIARSKAGRFYVVMQPGAERGLLVYADDGVKAAPIACAR